MRAPRARGGNLRAVLTVLLNVFLVAFWADTGISVLDELGMVVAGHRLLGWVREPVALLVWLGTYPLFLLLLVTPVVSRRIFLPLALFPTCTLLLCLPIAYLLDWADYGVAQVTFMQLGFSLGAAWLVRRTTGGPLLLAERHLTGPLFSLRSTLALTLATLLVIVPVLGASFLGLCDRCLDRATAGFMDLRWHGLELVERVYEREESRVRLVGMMHIGEKSSYEALVASFDSPEVVVLTEGVSDRQGLFAGELHYKAMAEKIGLDSQQDFSSYHSGINMRPSDVDISELSPGTIEWIQLSGKLFVDGELSIPGLLAMFEASADITPEEQDQFWVDLIDLRNEALLGHLRESITEYPVVVVPWGAFHLPGIEQSVLEMGFVLESECNHPLVSWAQR